MSEYSGMLGIVSWQRASPGSRRTVDEGDFGACSFEQEPDSGGVTSPRKESPGQSRYPR